MHNTGDNGSWYDQPGGPHILQYFSFLVCVCLHIISWDKIPIQDLNSTTSCLWCGWIVIKSNKSHQKWNKLYPCVALVISGLGERGEIKFGTQSNSQIRLASHILPQFIHFSQQEIMYLQFSTVGCLFQHQFFIFFNAECLGPACVHFGLISTIPPTTVSHIYA